MQPFAGSLPVHRSDLTSGKVVLLTEVRFSPNRHNDYYLYDVLFDLNMVEMNDTTNSLIPAEKYPRGILNRYRALLRACRNCIRPEDRKKIRKAFEISLATHQCQKQGFRGTLYLSSHSSCKDCSRRDRPWRNINSCRIAT
jgi:hypothetical protein